MSKFALIVFHILSQVAPLVASQASSDIQDGSADIQDDVLLNASIFEWPDPDSCSSSSSAVVRSPAAERPENANWVRASVFSVATPHTWNTLPFDVRSCRTVDTFKRHLKTHLFRQS